MMLNCPRDLVAIILRRWINVINKSLDVTTSDKLVSDVVSTLCIFRVQFLCAKNKVIPL